jgi:integrase/recombinase XerC
MENAYKSRDITSYIESYLRYVKGRRGLSEATVKTYAQDLFTFANFLDVIEVASFEEVDRRTVRSFLAFLVDKGYQRSSISRKLSVLRGYYRWMVSEELISIDPIPKRSVMKKETKLPRFLSSDEVSRLIEIPKMTPLNESLVNRDVALLELIYASGLRVSEVHSLDLKDLDLNSRVLRVMGKGNKERITLIGTSASKVLSKYITEDRIKIDGADKNNALFLGKRGTRFSIRSIQDMVKKYSRLAGLGNEVHTHTLRHSFATHLLNGGADLRVVQDLLGHSSPATTQIYTHVTGVEARRSYLKAHPLAQELTEEI